MNEFEKEVQARIAAQASDDNLKEAVRRFLERSIEMQYSYNFSWMGRPIIQYPQDMVAVQELIWKVRPDLVIDTGVAHGGSLILSASLLALLDYCDAVEQGVLLDPTEPKRRVLGVDIDIRQHNRNAIEQHPMRGRIDMIEGSSIDPAIVDEVRQCAAGLGSVMVFLDSNHTHEHVLAELNAYSGLVSVGSYCVVFDTIVEDLSDDMFPDRPWGPGDNPKTAVWKFLETNSNFIIDRSIQDKLQITVAPDGFLKRVES